ncbi:GGDEF domain-containing protein [Salsuginibacillus kocurii]|uniref:GGDEF domain-containing protein n=1 Tax=Salsuginibacillus kocurii TaxID=427078 RepID=UPI0003746558|nr:GGDEF domain-containing protein [Salsuginibacillus kocurii]
MNSRFQLKLFVIMLLFALVISFAIATINYFQIRDQAIEHHDYEVEHIIEVLENSLKTYEKAHFIFEENTAASMEEKTHFLLDYYEEVDDFEEWNFYHLKEYLGMDVYIINSDNVITHSSFQPDIGLDFSECCQNLVPVLEERRSSGDFYHDGAESEQATGDIKKYSYMGTPDEEYLIQLSYDLEEEMIFSEFNVLDVIDSLTANHSSLNEINILNIGGLTLGEAAKDGKVAEQRREAYETTSSTQQTTTFNSEWKGEPALFKYVYNDSEYDGGTTQNKVIEIIYNEDELQSSLHDHFQGFIMQLFLVVLITMLLAFILYRWTARPMHLAYHDNLTGLHNRTAFEDQLHMQLKESNNSTALLMIDLDNFKCVNDKLGHDEGDQLLKQTARSIQSVARKGDLTFRMGGDEFVMMIPDTSKQEVKEIANRLIETAKTSIQADNEGAEIEITVSVGIALAPEHSNTIEELYKKADKALYNSKEKGKNQFHLYEGK